MSEVIIRGPLVDDAKVILHDADLLLKETAGNLGEKAREARVRLEQGFKAARERLGQIQGQAVEQTKAAAKATDQLVNDHPWSSVGIAFAVGALVGLVIGRRN